MNDRVDTRPYRQKTSVKDQGYRESRHKKLEAKTCIIFLIVNIFTIRRNILSKLEKFYQCQTLFKSSL